MPTLRSCLTGSALLLALAAAPLWSEARAADAAPSRGGPFPDRRGLAEPVLPPCTCRAQGRLFDMGEEACLATPDGPRLAICAMDQNVSSWKPTARTCPSASRGGGLRPSPVQGRV